MRKPLTALSGIIMLAAAGFAGASIVAGGGLAGIGAVLTGTTTGATTTVPTTPVTTTGDSGGRRVTICHLTGSKHKPGHTKTVDQNAVAAHLRHGDHLGPCTGAEQPKQHGTKSEDDHSGAAEAAKKADAANHEAEKRDEAAKKEAEKRDEAAKHEAEKREDAGKSEDSGKSGGHGKSGK